ncbi:hypothetical protein AVEN_190387-1 [Araneus ventricosus]|uniref:Uncharacterized protein n=1 Tax=Araneus ventricosus TaxID=182803 RepID=A0A4Y2LW07_ARAVE|nr:hypothetical protein AVEN_190387-1 [Araneus ventricosus]
MTFHKPSHRENLRKSAPISNLTTFSEKLVDSIKNETHRGRRWMIQGDPAQFSTQLSLESKMRRHSNFQRLLGHSSCFSCEDRAPVLIAFDHPSYEAHPESKYRLGIKKD